MPWSQPGSWAQRGPVPTWSQALAPEPAEAGQAVLPGAVGRTPPAPAASARALSTGQLSPTAAELWPPASAQRGTLGHRAIYLALWPPFLGPSPSPLQEKPHFKPQLPPARTPTLGRGGASAASVGEEQVVCSLPASLLGASWGTALEAPPCHPPVLRVSFLWRLPAGWLGPSCPRSPSFYLCWCLQFGVGSLGRQLRPVLAERCCVSLCGWTRPSLAPPRPL